MTVSICQIESVSGTMVGSVMERTKGRIVLAEGISLMRALTDEFNGIYQTEMEDKLLMSKLVFYLPLLLVEISRRANSYTSNSSTD